MFFIGLLAFSAIVTNAFGNDPEQGLEVEIQTVGLLPKVSVLMKGLHGETLVQLKDAEGHLLIKESTNEAKYGKIFDFSELKDGRYELLLLTGNKEIVQPVFKNGRKLTVNKDYRKVYFSPVVRVQGSQVDLTWFNGRVCDMKVAITTPNGDVIFADQIDNVIKVEKRYNLQQVESGNYTMVINTPRRTYYETIKLD